MSYIKRIVKNNRYIYNVYNKVFTFFISLLGIFIKADKNQILFVVYGGLRYDDSPRFIYEEILKRGYPVNMKWAFIDPDDIECQVPPKNRIKIDTLKYFIEAHKSGVWITNSSVSRGLDFKKKKTKYFLFSHGTVGIKKLGKDIHNIKYQFNGGVTTEVFDAIFIEGKKEDEILSRAWEVDKEIFIKKGLPRNDELVNYKSKDIYKQRLGITTNKKIILYAPTFREYDTNSTEGTFLKPPINFEKWEKELSDEYVLLVTAHYAVEKMLELPKNSDFIINAVGYPHINDLMIVSDLLVSDYSSIILEYSLLERPILSFSYDFEVYSEMRGIYAGYEDLFFEGISYDELSVIEKIKNLDYKTSSEYVSRNIKEKYIVKSGDATTEITDYLFEVLKIID